MNDLHKTLFEVMKTIPRMAAVKLPELKSGGKRLREYVVGSPVRIRVSEQVDLEMDALIRDGELGSLGVVHRVDARTDVRRLIDQAAYLRHLLVEEMRSTANANRPAYAVEVVLALPGDDAPNLGETLRTILRDGTYLHAVGVNVWSRENGSLADPAAVRRAFSWLLAETERWFRSRPSAATPRQELQRLTLHDFRVAGPRVFEFGDDHQLHVVHGHNGSGKSSVCEALELLATGKVARLDGQDHDACLANREAGPSGAATIAIRQGREERRWTVAAAGISEPLGTMNPNAFRLDQTVADQLTHSTSADRARLFLSAFFDVESKGLLERSKLLADARTHLANLPTKIAESIGRKTNDLYELDDAKAREQLQWLGDPSTTNAVMTWDRFLDLMPLSRTQVDALGAMLPRAVRDRFQQSGPASAYELQNAAQALDDALQTLVPDLDRRKETLTNAVAVLERYALTAVGGAAESGGDLALLMRRWQRLHALHDLLEREEQIVETIYDVKQRGEVFGRKTEPYLSIMAVWPNDRRLQIRALGEDRDKARARVVSFVSDEERKAAAQAAAPADPVNLDALTAAASLGVFGEDLKQATPALGQALRDALAQGQPVTVHAGSSSIAVGTSGWGQELLAKSKAALAAITQLASARAELPAPPRTLVALLPALRELHKAAVQIGRLDAEDVKRLDDLFAENGALRQALNEMTALFTPARWAYRDVVPSASLRSSEQSLDLQAYGISAKFLLNTAELNTLALSIFLLCSRRDENPLRMLVLDDPLQNMDELTVTTIARGLARILRLWKRHIDHDASPWRVLLLLHGEDDVERIRSEVPCDVHLLPWLAPSAAAATADGKVPWSASLLREELQTLETVIEPR